MQLGDREAGAGHVVLAEEGVVAAGRLGTALQDVTGDHRPGEGVEGVGRPAEAGDPGPGDQRRIRHPAGDHHVRALGQAGRDAEAAEVGVGGQQALGQAEFLSARQQVVTLDVRDGRLHAQAPGQFAQLVGEPGRVEAARVHHDPHAALAGQAEALLHLPQEGPGVAERRVLQPVTRQDQHRQLGQVVPGEHVQRPAGEHLPHRREAVPVEPRGVADPQYRAFAHQCASPAGELATAPHGRRRAAAWHRPEKKAIMPACFSVSPRRDRFAAAGPRFTAGDHRAVRSSRNTTRSEGELSGAGCGDRCGYQRVGDGRHARQTGPCGHVVRAGDAAGRGGPEPGLLPLEQAPSPAGRPAPLVPRARARRAARRGPRRLRGPAGARRPGVPRLRLVRRASAAPGRRRGPGDPAHPPHRAGGRPDHRRTAGTHRRGTARLSGARAHLRGGPPRPGHRRAGRRADAPGGPRRRRVRPSLARPRLAGRGRLPPARGREPPRRDRLPVPLVPPARRRPA